MECKHFDNQCDLGRRQFFRHGALALGSLVIASWVPWVPGFVTQGLAAGEPVGAKPVDENDPLARSLGYKKDATKVDLKKFPKRAEPGANKQYCDNCQFYKAQSKSQGSCQIFQSNLVAAKGWCNSWVQKA